MNNTLSISELENRMRPHSFSTKGFLGPEESLENVIQQDTQLLKSLNISHQQIADSLERVLLSAFEQKKKMSASEIDTRFRKPIPDLYHPQTIPHFTSDNLPEPDIGILVDDYQVFLLQYRGFQVCPWECDDIGWSSFDFLILNRKLGEYFTGPGLIVHLIREHHFFEGKETPFRTDPIKAIRVLEVSPKGKLQN